MRASIPSPVRRTAGIVLVAAALLLGRAPEAAAVSGVRPALLLNTGMTAQIEGDVSEGGAALALAMMWPLESGRFTTGLSVSADDFGTLFGDLHDPVTGQFVGQTPTAHRDAYGGAWRIDAALAPGSRWEPFATATWGFYRMSDDSLGALKQEWNSAGMDIGAGVRRVIRDGFTIGASVLYHRRFNDRVGRYLSASLEWGWR